MNLEFDSGVAQKSPPCLKCGSIYENGTVFCITCGLSLLTGQPIAQATEDKPRWSKFRNPDAALPEEMPFWKITLRVVTHPLSTLEMFPVWFRNRGTLGMMVAFYVASFIGLGAAAWSMGRRVELGRVAGPGDADLIEQIEKNGATKTLVPTSWQLADSTTNGLHESGTPFRYRFLTPSSDIDAGRPFTTRLEFREAATDEPIVGAVWAAPTAGWGNAPGGDWQPLVSKTPGTYEIELDAARAGGTSFAFALYPPGGVPDQWIQPLRGTVHANWASNPGWGKLVLDDQKESMESLYRAQGIEPPKQKGPSGLRALSGAASIAGAILASIVGLVIAAGVLTFAARLMGGGGSFLMMLITLAYLTGFSNTIQLGLVFLPEKHQVWAQYAFAGYGFLLQLWALMKVFDLDLLLAIVTTFLSGVIQLFGAVWIVVSFFKIAGLVV